MSGGPPPRKFCNFRRAFSVLVGNGNIFCRPALCPAEPAHQCRVHRGGRRRVGARDWSHRRYFHCCERRHAGSAALLAAGPPDAAGTEVSERLWLLQLHPQIHGLAQQRRLRFHDALRTGRPEYESGRRREPAPGQSFARLPRLFPRVRRRAVVRPHLHRSGRPAARRGGCRAQLPPVAEPYGRRPASDRAQHPVEPGAVHRGGRDAEGF